uniref:Uncharacterized protein n=1 Tax=Anguilla anguilla TaxID=7936 RepID=A0A0E9P628_ANGAN
MHSPAHPHSYAWGQLHQQVNRSLVTCHRKLSQTFKRVKKLIF